MLLASIHVEARDDRPFAGEEDRIDVAPAYFERLAADVGLVARAPYGSLCGQETFVFAKA